MKRIEREKATVNAMIRYYCRKNHKTKHLCEDCAELSAYANIRLEKCKFADDKPTCKACPVHCYSATMREKIRQVMVFSGPAMLFRHPILAFYHLTIDSR